MKKLIFVLGIMSFANAQTISPDIKNTSGSHFQNSHNNMDVNIGEPVTGLISNSHSQITQGFLQPDCFPPSNVYDTVNAAICSGSNYTLPNGQIVNSGGSYISTFHLNVCADSIIVTNLTVNTNCTSIPTLSEWGLICFSALLLGTGIFFVKKFA